MLGKIQRFGGAMLTPVLLFPFAAIVVGITIMMKNPAIVGNIADPDGFFWKLMKLLEEGAWTIFRNMPVLFAIGLPIGLAKKAHARACLAVLFSYLTFNYFVAGYLTLWPDFFNVDFAKELSRGDGLAIIAGIKTLDTSIIGGIMVAAIVTAIHNRFYDTKLPDYIGVFQGASFVVILSYFTMLLFAFLTCLIWPKIQIGIAHMQGFMVGSGSFGIWVYTFLERLLIPTGLHHFIYAPFVFGPAVVEGGIHVSWAQQLTEFSNSTIPLIRLFPEGGFSLYGSSKIFGSLGIASAFYATAKPENKTKVLAILIPATFTAMLVGVTEPLEFTFLFIAPYLFAVHAILAATLATTLYNFGVVGDLTGGVLQALTLNWAPMWANHSSNMWLFIGIGLVFSGIYFFVFKTLIIKFNIMTPGRGSNEDDIKLTSKKEYKEGKSNPIITVNSSSERGMAIINALGGRDNIESLANCATRLRVNVKNPSLILPKENFTSLGAHGVIISDNYIQIIVGLGAQHIKEECAVHLAY
ncbi:alpha-glucoside-specific PTS transporter subunit IIBC [Vibrio rumoiensis]|uniref:Alpha-glucoside-specific PTS transporter subunit IIBC n=1 Tax=Vibrio rumoiensis TaxID=76258 RepID=A0ABW7J073_9VIBR